MRGVEKKKNRMRMKLRMRLRFLLLGGGGGGACAKDQEAVCDRLRGKEDADGGDTTIDDSETQKKRYTAAEMQE